MTWQRRGLAVLAAAVMGIPSCQRGGLSSIDAQPMAERHPADSTAAAPQPSPAMVEDEPAGPVDVLFINEDSITVVDAVEPVRTELAAQRAAMPPNQFAQMVDKVLRDRIRTMARDLLLYQEASRRLSDQEAEYLEKFTDQRIREIVQKEHAGRQVRWEQAMAEQGLTPEKAREKIRRELVVIRHLQQVITPRIQEPTRRELLNFYEKVRPELSSPERRQMLLIEIPKDGNAAAARQTAKTAQTELQSGTPFEEVARRWSKGVHAEDGGDWGMINPDSITGRWAQAAEALVNLPAGGTSGIIETESGYFIVRVGMIEPRQEPGFAEVQRDLTERYRDQQFNMLVDELVLRLQERAVIRPENLNLFLEAAVNAVLNPETGTPAVGTPR